MQNIHTSKFDLGNGNDLYLIEQVHEKENPELKSPTRGIIKINHIQIPYMTSNIILSNNGEYIGYISALLYENQMASLIFSGLRNIELPDELKKYHEKINKCDAALLVDEKYRGQKRLKNLFI